MRYSVYEIDFEGMTPYGTKVFGYYGEDGVIYDKNGLMATQEEIDIRNLYIDNTKEYDIQ